MIHESRGHLFWKQSQEQLTDCASPTSLTLLSSPRVYHWFERLEEELTRSRADELCPLPGHGSPLCGHAIGEAVGAGCLCGLECRFLGVKPVRREQ